MGGCISAMPAKIHICDLVFHVYKMYPVSYNHRKPAISIAFPEKKSNTICKKIYSCHIKNVYPCLSHKMYNIEYH